MIAVEFTGTLAHILRQEIENKQDGSKRTKYELVVTATNGNYVDTLSLQTFKDDVVEQLKEGVAYTVRGAVNTREWQGRYFTQVNLLNITPVEVETSAPSPQQGQNVKPKAVQKAEPAPMEPQRPIDPLPF